MVTKAKRVSKGSVVERKGKRNKEHARTKKKLKYGPEKLRIRRRYKGSWRLKR